MVDVHVQQYPRNSRTGRPRSTEADTAILEATRAALVDLGWSKLTMGDVAGRAGVAKTTLYRRWANKNELVVDAVAVLFDELELPDLGSLQADIEHVVLQFAALLELPETKTALMAVVAESTRDAPLRERIRASIVDRQKRLVLTGRRMGAAARRAPRGPRSDGRGRHGRPDLRRHRGRGRPPRPGERRTGRRGLGGPPLGPPRGRPGRGGDPRLKVGGTVSRSPPTLTAVTTHLTDSVRALLDDVNPAVLATIQPDGSPQTSVVWVGRDGDDLPISSQDGRRKIKNIRADARVSLTVHDRRDPLLYAEIRGTATVAEDTGRALAVALAESYEGEQPAGSTWSCRRRRSGWRSGSPRRRSWARPRSKSGRDPSAQRVPAVGPRATGRTESPRTAPAVACSRPRTRSG